MKTDPTSSISGAAGTPLSNSMIQLKRNSVARNHPSAKSPNAIADTLETTDRESDGRRQTRANPGTSNDGPNGLPGTRLDVTG